MRHTIIPALIMCVAITASGCGAKKEPDVWNTYDLRYPVPAGTLPPAKGQQYDRYIDNDAFYTPPNFGLCGSSNINCVE